MISMMFPPHTLFIIVKDLNMRWYLVRMGVCSG